MNGTEKKYIDKQDVSLKEYFESQINNIEKRFMSEVGDIEKNTALARVQMEKRLEGMNEFRDQLKDQAGTFIPRSEVEQRFSDIYSCVKRMETAVATVNGKMSQDDVFRGQLDKRLESMNEFRLQLKDQASTFLSRAEYDINHKAIVEDIRILREYRATLDGKASTTSFYIALALSMAGLILGIVHLFK